MKRMENNHIERHLKKEALRKGVYVKEVNMPIHNFAQSFKTYVAPYLTMETVYQIVEKALSACNSLYKDDNGITRVKVEDSNMPGLVDNKFDIMNAYLLSEINNTKTLNEMEQSDTITNLCWFVEELSENKLHMVNE